VGRQFKLQVRAQTMQWIPQIALHAWEPYASIHGSQIITEAMKKLQHAGSLTENILAKRVPLPLPRQFLVENPKYPIDIAFDLVEANDAVVVRILILTPPSAIKLLPPFLRPIDVSRIN
jgi:hypothetical protein